MKDWNEKKLDEELNALVEELPLKDDLEKKINQSINRRIRKIIITTVSATLILAFDFCHYQSGHELFIFQSL